MSRPVVVTDAEIVATVQRAERAGDVDYLEGGIHIDTLADRVNLNEDWAHDRVQQLVADGKLVQVWGAAPETYRPRLGYRTPDSLPEVVECRR